MTRRILTNGFFKSVNHRMNWFLQSLVIIRFDPRKSFKIKTKGKSYDVRFFDSPNFSRCVLPVEKLRSIDYKTENDEELELPLELLEKHRQKLCEKGFEFLQTVTKMEKSSDKKRAKSAQKERFEKRKRLESKPPKSYKTKRLSNCLTYS